MLEGSNCVVLDCETLRSAQDCRVCGQEKIRHAGTESFCDFYVTGGVTDVYLPIGWDNHRALGLSIGCSYWYRDQTWQFFDQHTLLQVMGDLIDAQPLIVSFNGRQFDGPLLLACVDDLQTVDVGPGVDFITAWQALWDRSYDILAEIWRLDADRKYEHGLNSLDALCEANGLPRKEMDGARAPRLWAQGRIAEVVSYNLGDVMRTCRLFEQVVRGEPIRRRDGSVLVLPQPLLPSRISDSLHT